MGMTPRGLRRLDEGARITEAEERRLAVMRARRKLDAALEGERRTHAAAVRAGSTRQEATMREPTMREPDAHAGASEPTAGVYGAMPQAQRDALNVVTWSELT